ncbi:MAG: nucleoside 2-deoxyribosyltransferase [Bacteroidales bacterium]|jgi:nucleoside 2-deoxyribosyltransferase
MKSRILLIGDILVDLSLKTKSQKYKLRFGGIIHAARYLWSAGVEFDVAFFAPAYLKSNIKKCLDNLHCRNSIQLGEVTGAPYIILIEEVKEIGDQGYEFLLRDDIKIEYNADGLRKLKNLHYTDVFFISGNYLLQEIINNVSAERFHLDLANNVEQAVDIPLGGIKLDTLFLSTSSGLFKHEFKNSFSKFAEIFSPYSKRIILKENRGGSRLYNFSTTKCIKGFTQIQSITHSVGVGDVFDVAFIHSMNFRTEEESLTIASWISSEYASTTFPDDFREGVNRVLNSSIERLMKLKGISVPWEDRSKINIYIAAPDFDFLDTSEIESMCKDLEYHNFSPRRPIQEIGFMEKDASTSKRQELFCKDMQLLEGCSMLLAILLNNDPGTLIEIGIAAERRIPTLVYDPYGIANNCMLTQIPDLLSRDKDEILVEIFIKSDQLINGKMQ